MDLYLLRTCPSISYGNRLLFIYVSLGNHYHDLAVGVKSVKDALVIFTCQLYFKSYNLQFLYRLLIFSLNIIADFAWIVSWSIETKPALWVRTKRTCIDCSSQTLLPMYSLHLCVTFQLTIILILGPLHTWEKFCLQAHSSK